jgi:dTDP-4-dehydrorhamnose 3,5-epimerase
MEVETTPISGLLIFKPKIFGDSRGFFLETYNHDRYRDAGLQESFVQDNMSYSQKGVLRGLHFQKPYTQGKLVSVVQGQVWDVAVDLRKSSTTFGKWFGLYLDGESKIQFYVPPGFAHGFVVTSDTALFSYKCTETYHPECESSLLWNDPDVGIRWPKIDGVEMPQLSNKDAQAPRLKDISSDRLFP